LKILVDTNVWIAALIGQGFSKEVLDYCIGRHAVWSSEFILAETSAKLRTKFALSGAAAREFEGFVRRHCAVLDDSRLEAPRACRDRDDDKVLAAAAAIAADGILTGDQDLLVLTKYAGMWILTPRDFWRKEGQSQ